MLLTLLGVPTLAPKRRGERERLPRGTPTGRYLITMVGPIFDPGRSPGMKTYQGGEERKRKRGEEEEKKRRKES